ncbi:MAG: PBSX family phage terminase large subunit, partial [Gracilibacteraceae bacterium]|nr:PBSX family phage terminase large subunit [Gracilibacteraceae bacterium]
MMIDARAAAFKFKPFSRQQKKILTWWLPEAPVSSLSGIIADGAIRSGKTLSMSLAFAIWGMETFASQKLALCGKSIGSLRRNVVDNLKLMLLSLGYGVKDNRGDNKLIVSGAGRQNVFHLFGGKDEASQDLIQGVTLAGIMFDEVALMPESFVNQAIGRCSVMGSRFWFNCNPEMPMHWFKTGWIDRAAEKRLVYLHFTMDDNRTLGDEMKERYRNMYFGVFYRRFILGQWVAADGLIYDMFDETAHVITDADIPTGMIHHPRTRRYVGIDFGAANATACLDVYDDGQTFWVLSEYYHSGRQSMKQKTITEYADDLAVFIAPVNEDTPGVSFFIIDPSALPFRLELIKRGLRVKEADNEVLDGIRV